MRAAWLTAGAVATVIALLLSTALLWRGFSKGRAPQEFQRKSIAFTLPTLKVRTGKGQVNLYILPGKAGELQLNRYLRWTSLDRPAVTEKWDGRSLLLDVDCKGSGQPDGPLCEADYTLLVPPETDIEATTTVGDLGVNQITGGVRLTTVSGQVSADNTTGKVWARSGSGTIEARGLYGDQVDVETGSGDVDMNFIIPPQKVRAVARAMGNVSVSVPPSDYDVTVEGRNTSVEIEKSPDSSRKINALAPLGSVSVRYW